MQVPLKQHHTPTHMYHISGSTIWYKDDNTQKFEREHIKLKNCVVLVTWVTDSSEASKYHQFYFFGFFSQSTFEPIELHGWCKPCNSMDPQNMQDFIFSLQPVLDRLQLILCTDTPQLWTTFLQEFHLSLALQFFLTMPWESAGTAVWCIKHSLWRVCIKFRKLVGFLSPQGKSVNIYDFAEISRSVVVLFLSFNK